MSTRESEPSQKGRSVRFPLSEVSEPLQSFCVMHTPVNSKELQRAEALGLSSQQEAKDNWTSVPCFCSTQIKDLGKSFLKLQGIYLYFT